MNFSDFSYSETAKTLYNAAIKNNISHALLIEGAEGSGKRELAFVLAKAILFGGEKKIGDAKDYQNGIYPDLFFFDGKNKGDYSADNLRKIREEVFISPWVCEQKVFILANIDLCDPKYSNILLKCIEEPPGFVRFILTAPSKTVLLPTIASRVSDYKLLPPPTDHAEKLLLQKGVPENRAKSLAALFMGNIGDAYAAYQDESFAGRLEVVREVIGEIYKGDQSLIALSLSQLYLDKNESLATLLLLERYFLMLAKENVCQNSGISVIMEVSGEFFDFQKLYDFAKIFREAADKLLYNGNINLTISAMQVELFRAL